MMLVSISLFVLFAYRPAAMPVSQPQHAPAGPFAYVREDGSEVYLQHGSALPQPEIHASQLEAAVYSWSSPATLD
jgi:hypothetical protein